MLSFFILKTTFAINDVNIFYNFTILYNIYNCFKLTLILKNLKFQMFDFLKIEKTLTNKKNVI